MYDIRVRIVQPAYIKTFSIGVIITFRAVLESWVGRDAQSKKFLHENVENAAAIRIGPECGRGGILRKF